MHNLSVSSHQSSQILSKGKNYSTPLVVAMPGTGFDGIFAWECFQQFAMEFGYDCTAIQPDPLCLIESTYHSIADLLSERNLILAGLSISSAIAVQFALTAWENSSSDLSSSHTILAIIAALPAWTAGRSNLTAPARLSAQYISRNITQLGMQNTIVQMENTTPLWLSQHLTRSWAAYGENLATLCLTAADYPGPSLKDLQKLSIPLLTIGLSDDPIHPASIAQEWAAAAPYGIYRQTTLQNIAQDLSEFSVQALIGYTELNTKFPSSSAMNLLKILENNPE